MASYDDLGTLSAPHSACPSDDAGSNDLVEKVGPVKKYGLVVPIHNAKAHLPQVLGQLDLGDEWEIVLVDDGSVDGSGELACRLVPQATLITNPRPTGPAEARNLGFKATTAEIVVFVDSDVVATNSAIHALASFLESRDELSAAFGAYNDEPAVKTPVSRFRNLLHHYVHCRSGGEIPSFWSGFGVVRRASFEQVGGFDSGRYPVPSVEDIDLGVRLWSAGHRAYLEPSLQVTHLKHWTVTGFMRTDINQRARPWVTMILEGRAPKNALNLDRRFKMPIYLLALTLLTTLVSLTVGNYFWLPALSLLGYLWCNGGIYRFMGARGLGLPSVFYLGLHHLCALAGAGLAVLDHTFGRRR